MLGLTNSKIKSVAKRQLNKLPNASAADMLVQGLFSIYFSPVFVKTKPFISNLLKYKAIIENPTVPPAYGYVDFLGRYMTYGSHVITDRKKIQFILSIAIELPFSDFNITLYEVKIDKFRNNYLC